jgi:hypothetical protein
MSRVYRVVISVFCSKISSVAVSVFLEQVVQIVATTWTTGERVEFALPRLSDIVESEIDRMLNTLLASCFRLIYFIFSYHP